MHFIVDKDKKVIFGWSAKCGSNHIKKIFWFLKGSESKHRNNNRMSLPLDIENYTTIIFIRNPYKRLISGFLDKYNKTGQMRRRWKQKNLTFMLFVEELINKNWKTVDFHHFTPQTTEMFDLKIMNSKEIKCFDLENINYKYINKVFDKKLPPKIIEYTGRNNRKKYKSTITHDVFDLNIDDYYENNIDLQYFYNDKLIKKVYEFYKDDFCFFKNSFNIAYTIN